MRKRPIKLAQPKLARLPTLSLAPRTPYPHPSFFPRRRHRLPHAAASSAARALLPPPPPLAPASSADAALASSAAAPASSSAAGLPSPASSATARPPPLPPPPPPPAPAFSSVPPAFPYLLSLRRHLQRPSLPRPTSQPPPSLSPAARMVRRPRRPGFFTAWMPRRRLGDALKTMEEREKEKDSRLKVYLSMCLSGVTTLYWSGAATILLDLNTTNSTVAYSFLLCSIFSLTVMLLAITAGTFPSTAPGKMEFAGLGAWQAMIFVITSFHLATFKLHPGPVFFWISMIGFLILLSIFWGISSEDPVFLHVTAKLVVWGFCSIAYAFYLFGCKIARKGRAANDGGNDPDLHGPLLAPQVPQLNNTP